MMASPKMVNEAMSKADSLDSAHWLASSAAGFKTNSSFQKRSHAGSGGGAGGAGNSSYAPMDLGNILLNALKEAGVQGMPQRPQRPQQAQDASRIKCYACGEYGHMKKDCPKRKMKTLMTAGPAADAAEGPGEPSGSKN